MNRDELVAEREMTWLRCERRAPIRFLIVALLTAEIADWWRHRRRQ